jgi:hypothetical protein
MCVRRGWGCIGEYGRACARVDVGPTRSLFAHTLLINACLQVKHALLAPASSTHCRSPLPLHVARAAIANSPPPHLLVVVPLLLVLLQAAESSAARGS